MDTLQTSVQFAGSLYGTSYAYQLVVKYKDDVYYSERLPREEVQAIRNNLSKANLERFINRGVLSTDY
jgi:hypothetical protein